MGWPKGKARKSAGEDRTQPGGVAPTPVAAVPLVSWPIPSQLQTTNLGADDKHTCHPWVMDRVLGWLGVHNVSLAGGVLTDPSGRRMRLVVAAAVLEVHDAR